LYKALVKNSIIYPRDGLLFNLFAGKPNLVFLKIVLRGKIIILVFNLYITIIRWRA